MVPQDDAPSKLPMTPRSAQCRVKAQIIKECTLPPTLASYADSFLKMIQPNDEQRKALEGKLGNKVYVYVGMRNAILG